MLYCTHRVPDYTTLLIEGNVYRMLLGFNEHRKRVIFIEIEHYMILRVFRL